MPAIPSGSPDASALTIRNVTKVYDGRRPVTALRDISLDIGRGALVAIRGRSGSGKSTLLNLMGGLDVPTSGSVIVAGTDLAPLSETQRSLFRRRHIAYVFQAYHLLPTLTCAQNVALPLHLQGLPAGEINRQVAQVLEDVGLGARGTHVPDELSGGERQRTAIARALVTAPGLLLADEPTGNLDSETSEQVLTLLRSVVEARQATLVMVTHDDRAAAECDRVIHLRDGQIDGEGP